MNTAIPTDELSLWAALTLHQGKPFKTASHLSYTYTIRNNEMFVSRKEKSITRSTIELAFHKVVKMQAEGIQIDGPKMIGTFGASYLYPVFCYLCIIRNNSSLKHDDFEAMQNNSINHDNHDVIPADHVITQNNLLLSPRKNHEKKTRHKAYPHGLKKPCGARVC